MTPVSLCICEFQLHHHPIQASQRKYMALESQIPALMSLDNSWYRNSVKHYHNKAGRKVQEGR